MGAAPSSTSSTASQGGEASSPLDAPSHHGHEGPSLGTPPTGAELVKILKDGVPPSNHWYHLKRYDLVVVGSDLVDFMVSQPWCDSRVQAVAIGKELVKCNELLHVTKEHDFEDNAYFYRWADQPGVSLNRVEKNARDYDLVVIGAGSAGLTAVDFALELGVRVALVEKHRTGGDCTWTGCVPSKALIKAAKVAHHARSGSTFGVHASGVSVDMAEVKSYVDRTIQEVWQHESPERLRAKGASVLVGAASFVDSNTIQVVETQTDDGSFGGQYPCLASESELTGPKPFDGAGADAGGFSDSSAGAGAGAGAGTSTAGGAPSRSPSARGSLARRSRTITSHYFLICTGARPRIPDVPGLDTVPYLTYETIFGLTSLPGRLVVMGTGPIGCEMAQAYSRLGSKVTIIGSKILGKEEPGVQEVMERVFRAEGITHVSGRPDRVALGPDGTGVVVSVGSQIVEGDVLLVSTGRRPNVEGLNLPAIGAAVSPSGIETDLRLKTTCNNVYAAGDVTGSFQFTHYAGFQGFAAARNMLVPGSSPGTSDLCPWSTFTSPEVAHVGLTAEEAKAKFGDKATVLRWDNRRTDRCVCDHDLEGYTSAIVDPAGKILGATVVSERAGEVIAEFCIAMTHKLSISDLAKTIHPYPTYGTTVMQMTFEEATKRFMGSFVGRIIRKNMNGPGAHPEVEGEPETSKSEEAD